MELRLRDLRRGYLDLANEVRLVGRPVIVRGLGTHELTGVTLRFDDVTRPMLPVGVGRRVNTKLAAVEALQLISGTIHPELLVRASPHYAQVLVNPGDLTQGAYGPRTRNALRRVVELLWRDPTSRQAVLSIWRDEDLTTVGDRPCTIGLQFLVRDDRLQLHTWMRSQDCVLGIPYDLFMFTQLQLTVAAVLGLSPGSYHHHVTSLHIYDRDLAVVDELHEPDNKPLLDELPAGVLSHKNYVHIPAFDAIRLNAVALLRGQALPADWLARNSWYAQRINTLHEMEVSS